MFREVKNYAAALMSPMLEVCYPNNPGDLFHLKVGNNKGFLQILEHTGIAYHFVMEATGVDYIRLAFYLHEKGAI